MKNNSLVTPEELDQFEQFIFEMDEVLDAFLADAKNAGFDLTYSIDGLDALEKYIVSRSNGGSDSRFQNRAARFLGELFRKTIGGKWQLCVKDPKYIYYKLPVLAGYSDKPIEFCPIAILNNVARKRESGMLTRAVEAHLEFKK